jgi:hypothetical protein
MKRHAQNAPSGGYGAFSPEENGIVVKCKIKKIVKKTFSIWPKSKKTSSRRKR